MELVIRVDLDKVGQSLAEVFRLVGDCHVTDEANEETVAGAGAPIRDARSQIIGEWRVEESEDAGHPEDSAYRVAAKARYARPRQIEVDRFAMVSPTDEGAFVQGWLFVPRSDVVSGGQETTVSRKPPQSVFTARNESRKAS